MKLILIALVLLGAVCFAQAASCPSDAGALAQKISGYAQKIINECVGDNLCDDDSGCLKAYLDYLSFLEDCYSQLDGAGINFSQIAAQYKAALSALCGNNANVIALSLFGSCANSDALLDSIKGVTTKCPATATNNACDDGCIDALQKYYTQLYKCYGIDEENQQLDSFRALLEHNCKFISSTQDCYQELLENSRRLSIECSSQDCTTSCQSAITAAVNAANDDCPDAATTLVAQYKAVCNAECGPVIKGDFSDVAEKCEKLKDLTATDDECTACRQAIEDASTDSSCLGTGNAAGRALGLLRVVQERACTADVVAKNLAGTDLFSNKAARVALGCRSVGVCNRECAAAIEDFTSSVLDAYDDSILPTPSEIKTAANAVSEVCDQVVTGYPYRVNPVLADLYCDYVYDHIEDIIVQFSIILKVSPSSLVIADCHDTNTRAPAADVLMASSQNPGKPKAASCQQAGLTCNSISTDSEGRPSGGSSSASTVVLSAASLFIALLVALLH